MIPTRRRPHCRFATVVSVLAFASLSRLASGQQPPARADTTPLRADYRSLGELLEKIPNVAPSPFDEERAMWLGALPLACLDRLQSRPTGRGGAAGPSRANAPVDTAAARNAPNNGAGYFWVPNYTLAHDHDRLRAFWGCTDWHSAVGSTWVAVRLLKSFPNTPLRELTREKLNAHLGKSNLDGELAFFHATAAAINPIPSASQTGLFERPYGFAWLLELQAELRTWPDTQAKRWAANVAPLAAWMADSLGAYMSKLVEPVRSGAQNNTAQSMALALDYAQVDGDAKLRNAIVTAARKFYLADTACATQSERVVSAAGGRGGRGGGRGAGRGANANNADSAAVAAATPNDLTAAATAGRGAVAPAPGGGGPEILSPCLTEAALMSRVLEPRAYIAWLDRFLPPFQSGRFAPLTEAISIPVARAPTVARGGASDTSAAAISAAISAAATALATERARLAALSFSRAQSMERIARGLPATDPRVVVLRRLSALQADRGFELMRDDAAGISWVPAQALLYETARR
ncbi:MAG: DUF2891 family protein [bacterium]